MSSKIEVQRICLFCKKEFTARTTVTKYCSSKCSKKAYKERIRNNKIKQSNNETTKIKNQPIEQLKAKEFLTVREVAELLNCSIRSVYHYIETGTLKAVNLGQRMTRVKRSEIDVLFNTNNNNPVNGTKQKSYKLEDCYTLTETQSKYDISEKALHEVVKRNNIPKLRKGKFAYIPKKIIDELLT